MWLDFPLVETHEYAGAHTAQTFRRDWSRGAESVRRSRWWSTGRVQRSARFDSGLRVYFVRGVTRIIYFITISVEDIKST